MPLLPAGGFDCALRPHADLLEPQLRAIAQISLPVPALVDAYKSGFITTQITRSGNHLDTGINGYEGEYSHDVIGILTNLFTQGYFTDAHALLTDARSAVGSRQPRPSYVDGLWTYPLPWAVYLLKTGDTSFVRQNFATAGTGRSGGRAQHRGRRPRHRGRPHRTDGHDGGDPGHRHRGHLDGRRLRGVARPRRLPVHRVASRRARGGGLGQPCSTQACWRPPMPSWPQTIAAKPSRLPALLTAPAQHG